MGSAVNLLAVLLLSSAVAGRGSESVRSLSPLPLLFVGGSHYEVGYKIGSVFRSEILTAMASDTFFEGKMMAYNQTASGSSLYSSYLKTASTTYPQYVEELHGIADGSQIPFSKVFLWNVKFEWRLLLDPRDLPTPSCSDIFLSEGENMTVFGHNEDEDPIYLTTSFLVHARITEEDENVDEFFAFCYPGELCGTAFGFNLGKAIAISSNAVFPQDINTTAMARNFLNRATLSLSLEEIRSTLQHVPSSSGFSLNVGSLDDLGVVNFELSPSGVVETRSGYGYHFNMYLHSSAPQYTDPSSVHRLMRVKELPPPVDAAGILTILGDTWDKEYPIYRTASPPDTAATICTGLFDLSRKVLYLYRGNPAQTDPFLVVEMQDP